MMMHPFIWGDWEQTSTVWPLIAFVLRTPRPNVLPSSLAERRIMVWCDPKRALWRAGYMPQGAVAPQDMEVFAESPSLNRVVTAVRDEWCAANVFEALNLVGDACD